jgi:hypothetical protein
MAQVGKPQITLNSIFFATPEQKVMKLLVSEPATLFTPRVICSRLKGVRGLGGIDRVLSILEDFQRFGFLEFVNNQRAVRIEVANPTVQNLMVFAVICSFEGLKDLLQPISSKGILFGSGVQSAKPHESEYDLFVITKNPDEVKKTAARHPLGRQTDLTISTPDLFAELSSRDPNLFRKVTTGVTLWGMP